MVQAVFKGTGGVLYIHTYIYIYIYIYIASATDGGGVASRKAGLYNRLS